MTQREERRQGWSSGEVRRNRGRDGREPDDGNLAKCGSPRGDLGQPRGGEDGGARGGHGDAWRRGKAQRRGREELAKLSTAMAMALSPSESREGGRERVDGRWPSAGCRGVHDSVDDLTSGASAGVRRQMAARCCAGRPRRRAELTIRACIACLIELLRR